MTIGTAEKDALALGLAYIETHPEDWDQNDWSACLAHWTMVNHPEVRSVIPTPLGVVIVSKDGTRSHLGPWLNTRYPNLEGLWSAGRTLDELQAGVRAVLDDQDVENAIVNALLDRVARAQTVRAQAALHDHVEDVLRVG